MLTVADYREIISGRRRGWRAAMARRVLSLFEPLVLYATQWRNRRYDRGRAQVQRIGVPVISVGNITTGGTGKTPFVAWLARWFRDRQHRVVLVSRGYGARNGAPNDEALELAELLPDVPHLQNADRVTAARHAEVALEADVVLLDDAYQHRRLHRDLEILLIDALEPFGFERLLPRGLLREPLVELRRADVIAISRADLVSNEQLAEISRRVREFAPSALLLELAHRPAGLRHLTEEMVPVESLVGQRIAAFCGLGNPRSFHDTLVRCGAKIVDFREYSDHFAFGERERYELGRWADRLDVEQVVCTMKDFVKLRVEKIGHRPLRALVIGMELLSMRDELEARLVRLEARLAPRE